MPINLFKYNALWISIVLFCSYTEAQNASNNFYSMTTGTYLAQANNEEGAKKQDLFLLAAGRAIAEGQWQQGADILAQTDDLTVEQSAAKNILFAKIDLMQDRPKRALAKLNALKDVATLEHYYQIEFHECLAQAHRAVGNNIESIKERIILESLLKKGKIENRRTLWLTLINLPLETLNEISSKNPKNETLRGWIELTLVAHKYRNNAKSLLSALDEWQTRFSEHPANQMLPNPLDSIAPKILEKPQKIALLLPLSGPFSGPGHAISEGFMAAHKAHKEDEATKITLYDTNDADVATLYQKAIEDGVQYVVGPLIKSQVATIASMDHPVPTLLLNDSDVGGHDNSYFFGLSPAHEASQVAIKARNKGYKRVLIIAPKNNWGHEISKVFIHQWKKDGGQVADSFLYEQNDDLNLKIRELLGINESQTREKQLRNVLGTQYEFLISRRQDFDIIFLLAYPSVARQIMPLLKYYYAGDVPIFATSSVYAGSANALRDKDLDGLIFCDIPWVFSHQMGSRNWPEQFNSYNRLYSLGMDSYALTTQLNPLLLFPADGAMSANGTLYLKPSSQVARVLEWGQFKQGLAHSLGDTV